jgi:hypothetical protein
LDFSANLTDFGSNSLPILLGLLVDDLTDGIVNVRLNMRDLLLLFDVVIDEAALL